MSLAWSELAAYLGTSEEQAQLEAVTELLKSELARLEAAELTLIRRYGVRSASELEARVNANAVPEHPSWEHLIEWEGIEDRRQRLRTYASRLEESSP